MWGCIGGYNSERPNLKRAESVTFRLVAPTQLPILGDPIVDEGAHRVSDYSDLGGSHANGRTKGGKVGCQRFQEPDSSIFRRWSHTSMSQIVRSGT